MPAEAFICDYVRTPIGSYGGALAPVRADDLAAAPIRELMRRHPGLDEKVDEVFLGCANQAGEDNRNLARMALLLAGLPDLIPGATINRLRHDLAHGWVCRSPPMSFTSTAPAAIAASATDARRVSMPTGTSTSPQMALIAGITRASSTASSTRIEPGLEHSPPTSMMLAPCSTMARARATAAATSSPRPSPLNEPGVVLMIPVTAV